MVHTRGRGAAHPSPSGLPFARCPCANPRGRGAFLGVWVRSPGSLTPRRIQGGGGCRCRAASRSRVALAREPGGRGGGRSGMPRGAYTGDGPASVSPWPPVPVSPLRPNRGAPLPFHAAPLSADGGGAKKGEGGGTRGGGRRAASGIARAARRSRVARGGGVAPLLFCATPFCEGGERGKGGAREIQGEGCARGAGRVAVGEGGSRGGA
ncbi:hypothetical protein BJY52DRAFT_1294164 [Lactarius psammicola]|nr:hypothetical protein BJY52DRAFT_1294164 [Lactarius psammicola]